MKTLSLLCFLAVAGCASAPTPPAYSPPSVPLPAAPAALLKPMGLRVMSAPVALASAQGVQVTVARKITPPPQVTLAWIQITNDPNIAGYNIYQGVTSGVYTNVQTIAPTNTTAVFTNLAFSTSYFFAATSFDTNAIAGTLESLYSPEVTYNTPFQPLPPGNFIIQSAIASALPGPWTPDTNWPPVLVANPLGNRFWQLQAAVAP